MCSRWRRPLCRAWAGGRAGGSEQPSFGNIVAVHTAYRDVMGGTAGPVGTDVSATAPISLQARPAAGERDAAGHHDGR